MDCVGCLRYKWDSLLIGRWCIHTCSGQRSSSCREQIWFCQFSYQLRLKFYPASPSLLATLLRLVWCMHYKCWIRWPIYIWSSLWHFFHENPIKCSVSRLYALVIWLTFSLTITRSFLSIKDNRKCVYERQSNTLQSIRCHTSQCFSDEYQ